MERCRVKHLILIPAYGRTYTSLSKLKEAWANDKDFAIAPMGRPYINKEDAEREGNLRLEFRYGEQLEKLHVMEIV
jgi:hypothetical protein